jgi:serine/threonine-protein kinase
MDVAASLNQALAGRYDIEREVGQGGMATVYLARDIRHNRRVALKVLHPDLAAALGAERFVAEITTTANLQHPHILPLHDSGDADGYLFYVMPYVEGETLRARLQREQLLPVEDAVRLAREILSALDYAHRHGVVHRDIKPENILLHDGSALVADFGISLAVSAASGPRMTQTGLSLGTPSYMSPEQAMGDRVIDGALTSTQPVPRFMKCSSANRRSPANVAGGCRTIADGRATVARRAAEDDSAERRCRGS